MVGTFHLHFLGLRIKYLKPEVGNTTQQFLSTAGPCCSIEFIKSFLFCVILITYNIGIYIWIYICKVSYIHSFFVIFNCNIFLHCMLNILRYEIKFVKLMSRLFHDSSSDVIFLGVHNESTFPLWCIFFQENCVSFGLLVSCLSLRQSA